MNSLVLNDRFESGSLGKDNRAVPFSADLCTKKNDCIFGGRFSSGWPHLAGADQFVRKYSHSVHKQDSEFGLWLDSFLLLLVFFCLFLAVQTFSCASYMLISLVFFSPTPFPQNNTCLGYWCQVSWPRCWVFDLRVWQCLGLSI